ncbi:mini-chromosome maintenance complex-binding protein-like isoform X2 [Panicum virgatum]|uniref:mini-chromosome maintenance complex-binding protein-like isoform X2 n=1 Tax=Panicum virgatum TaxID=38727 RepID=UPI0019D525CF|nr:mini-chromosome maintenance complex-binding protein-like isoform X2 [Panicum virgatum]
MVGPQYDLVGNPLGAVRATFERTAAAATAESGGSDPVAAFRGKDWGACELFRSFLFEEDGLDKVPVLNASNLGLIKPNTLVRYRGMVQDMLGNEYYIGAFKDGSTWRTNKFTDFSPFSMPHPCDSHLWERHLFHCLPAPGQNSWTLESSPGPDVRRLSSYLAPELREKRKREGDNDDMDVSENGHEGSPLLCKKPKEDGVHVSSSSTEVADGVPEMNGGDHHIPGSSFSCLVKVYDMPDSQVKLNDVIEFFGVYTFDPELATPSDNSDDIMLDLIEDVTVQLPPSKVPRLHCLVWRKLSPHDFISRPPVVELRNRVDVVTVGRLSLNFTGFNRESASIFGNQLYSLIQKLVPYSQAIPMSIEYLNTATLQPRKDNKSGRLVTGVLQLPQGSHLTFDETLLQSGSLTSKGVENTMLLKNLMESQKVDYDFEYYKLDMATDVQLLTLSEGKSNILPSDLVVPFRPSSVPTINEGSEELESWRWYLATVRSLPQSTEPETYQMIQDEMVSAMRDDRSLGCSELSRWLTMAQIIASSFAEKSLSLEHWQMVKELERLRKQRLQ